VRFLHTGDLHLGRTFYQQSRQPEYERVLREVVDIATRERVDCLLIAGDVFDSFSPPADAERLLYETLSEVARSGVRIVMIAGNHDAASRMDALSGIFRIAGIDCVGSVPREAAQSVLRIASRDGTEEAVIAALPWVPERIAVEYETLFGSAEDALKEYSARMEIAIRRCCESFSADTINVFLAHMLVSGAIVERGGGERPVHVGENFQVQPASLPSHAQYIALGHIHRMQRMAASAPAWYAGSLLQLDFGEAQQEKFVNLVDMHPRQPAEINPVAVTGGRGLRVISLALDELPQHAGRYGDDFLHVRVKLDRPETNVSERVREVLPNTLRVTPEPTDGAPAKATSPSRGLAPHELLARYYGEQNRGDIGEPLLKAFNELYEDELKHASA
jgi:exonuclease SbcD